ncbi:MAG: sensor domain-containing diguanylate cyclase [Deltaproteobacteria bacterium]|nr:sensor domain-containing diguanylate cyclase [Deltaproteobacteria bacterium]
MPAWRQFQDGLSLLLDIPVSLYDSSGALLSSATKKDGLLKLAGFNGNGVYREVYSNAVSRAILSGEAYIYRYNTDQYIFVVPVVLSNGLSLAVVAGEVCSMTSSERAEFQRDIDGLGLCRTDSDRLKRRLMRALSPHDLFPTLTTVKAMAAPFLKGLYSTGVCKRLAGKSAEERLKFLETMEKIHGALAAAAAGGELYSTILAKSTELVGAEQGSIMLLDSTSNALVVKAAKGSKSKMLENLRVMVGQGIAGSTVKKGTPVVITDIEAEIPSRKNRPGYRTRSFVSIPIKLGTRPIGVLNISDKITGEVFSEDDLRLLICFSNYASIAIEKENYHAMNEELKALSVTDPLTGILNRRYFQERLFEEVERSKRYGECFSVFMVDIDDFKVFNDRHGHLVGDEMLKGVSGAIKDAVRSIDVVARYGGEEFTVILPNTKKKDAFVIAERVRSGVEEFRLKQTGLSAGVTDGVTISVGVAEFPVDAKGIEELINNADKTMYFAKTMGKNRVVIYEG